MEKKCVDCGTTENLQEHHISYEPEVTVTLCVDCHMRRHNNSHGVGVGEKKEPLKPYREEKKLQPKLSSVKKEFRKFWREGLSYKELRKKFNVSYATINNWRWKLGLKTRKEKKQDGKKESVTVTIDRKVLEKIEEFKEKTGMNRSEVINELLRDRLYMESRLLMGMPNLQ